jgi:hypothetical protein
MIIYTGSTAMNTAWGVQVVTTSASLGYTTSGLTFVPSMVIGGPAEVGTGNPLTGNGFSGAISDVAVFNSYHGINWLQKVRNRLYSNASMFDSTIVAHWRLNITSVYP